MLNNNISIAGYLCSLVEVKQAITKFCTFSLRLDNGVVLNCVLPNTKKMTVDFFKLNTTQNTYIQLVGRFSQSINQTNKVNAYSIIAEEVNLINGFKPVHQTILSANEKIEFVEKLKKNLEIDKIIEFYLEHYSFSPKIEIDSICERIINLTQQDQDSALVSALNRLDKTMFQEILSKLYCIDLSGTRFLNPAIGSVGDYFLACLKNKVSQEFKK